MTRRQLKVWLVLLLFVHLLVHPTLHDFSSPASNTQVSQNTGSSASSADDCALCRDGSSLRVIAPLLLIHWQPVLLHLVPNLSVSAATSYESIAASPRGPPVY